MITCHNNKQTKMVAVVSSSFQSIFKNKKSFMNNKKEQTIKEDIMEPCPRDLFMSKTSSFWDEDTMDIDYDYNSNNNYGDVPALTNECDDYTKITNIYNAIGQSNENNLTIMMNDNDDDDDDDTEYDDELCRLCELNHTTTTDDTKHSSPLSFRYYNNNINAFIPSESSRGPSSQDPSNNTPKTPVPEKREASLMRNVLNEPPRMERITRSVHFWDEIPTATIKNQKEEHSKKNMPLFPIPSSLLLLSPPTLIRRRRSSSSTSSTSSIVLSPLSIPTPSRNVLLPGTTSMMTASTGSMTPPSPPVLTMIPPPTVQRVVPMTSSHNNNNNNNSSCYHVVQNTTTMKGNDDETDETYLVSSDTTTTTTKNERTNNNNVIIDFDPSMIERLRISAETSRIAQESSRTELELALNLFRLSNTSTPIDNNNNVVDCDDTTTITCNSSIHYYNNPNCMMTLQQDDTDVAVTDSITSTIVVDNTDEVSSSSFYSNSNNKKKEVVVAEETNISTGSSSSSKENLILNPMISKNIKAFDDNDISHSNCHKNTTISISTCKTSYRSKSMLEIYHNNNTYVDDEWKTINHTSHLLSKIMMLDDNKVQNSRNNKSNIWEEQTQLLSSSYQNMEYCHHHPSQRRQTIHILMAAS